MQQEEYFEKLKGQLNDLKEKIKDASGQVEEEMQETFERLKKKEIGWRNAWRTLSMKKSHAFRKRSSI